MVYHIVIIIIFTSLQNGSDEEGEPEPVREYTPAGKALKIKL